MLGRLAFRCAGAGAALACAAAAGAPTAGPAEGEVAPAAAPAACPAAPWAGDRTLRVDTPAGVRAAILHVPSGIRGGRPVAVVLALGGAGQTGRDFARLTRYSSLADRAGFAVLYPTATGASPFWNVSGAPGHPDDVAYLRALLDRAGRSVCVDPQRVFATGVSNGGGMAARLGCDLADRVAAIAPVAGGYRTLPACRPARPVSVLEIHGTDDRTVPYNGRSPDDEGRVDRYVWGWALRDGCGRTPRRSRLSPRVHRVDWGACAAGSTVVHLRLDGGEHAWPGSTPPGAGPRLPISATRETWRFFSAHPAA